MGQINSQTNHRKESYYRTNHKAVLHVIVHKGGQQQGGDLSAPEELGIIMLGLNDD